MTPRDPGLIRRLSQTRPIVHSEADFQHALAWQMHVENPNAVVRLETRPERGMRLDLLVALGDTRTSLSN